MGIINIKGFGNVEIAGDEPTKAEAQQIQKFIKENPASVNHNKAIEENTDNMLKSPSWGRIALEIGGSIAVSGLTGGFGLPLMAARMAMLTKPFLTLLAKSTVGSGVGAFGGSLAAETFDPTDHAFKTALRAAAYASTGEALLAGPTIKAFNFVGKVFKPALKAQVALDDVEMGAIRQEAIENLKAAEKKYGKAMVVKARQKFLLGEEVLTKKIDLINQAAKADLRAAEKMYGKALVEGARVAELTPGIRYNNRAFDMLENIAVSSIAGGGKLVTTKQGLRVTADSIVEEFNDELITRAARGSVEKGLFNTGDDVGTFFINALVNDNKAFNGLLTGRYSGITAAYNKFSSARLISTKGMRLALQKFDTKSKAQFVNAKGAQTALRGNIAYLKGKPNLNMEEYIKFRKGINSAMPPITTSNKQAFNDVGYALRAATQQMLKADTKIPGKIKDMLLETDDIFIKGTNFFNDDILRSVAKDWRLNTIPGSKGELIGSGSEVINQILNAKHPATITKLFKVLDGGVAEGVLKKEAVTNLRTGLKSKLFNDSLETSRISKGSFGTHTDPDKMLKHFDKYHTAFTEVFSKGELATMKDNFNALRLAYGKIAEEGALPGGVAITLRQPGAMVQLLGLIAGGSGFGIEGAVLLGGPWAISRAFTSKTVNRYLKTSFKEWQQEAVESFNKTGKISNFRKTATSLRQLSEKLVAEKIITLQQKEAFDQSIPFAIQEIQEDIRKQKENKINQETGQQPPLPPVTPRRPDPLDEAIDSIGPMSSAPTQAPQPQAQAPQPQQQASGIASLGNQPEQLARMEQVGLPLFR